MLTYLLVGIVAVIGLLAVIVALRPAAFRIERSAVMAAPPDAMFELVNDLHKWSAWSPWAKLDPAMRQTFEGAQAGVGAIHRWTGNKQVGEGALTIIESEPVRQVVVRLDFIKPFVATNTATFTFEPHDEGTRVTWSMEGQNNFVTRALCLFMNMDKMVGGQFEQGLSAMKRIVEAKSPAISSAA